MKNSVVERTNLCSTSTWLDFVGLVPRGVSLRAVAHGFSPEGSSGGRSYPIDFVSSRGELGHPAQVLNGSGQRKFVARAREPAQPQAAQLEDPLQVREQNLDLLALVT